MNLDFNTIVGLVTANAVVSKTMFAATVTAALVLLQACDCDGYSFTFHQFDVAGQMKLKFGEKKNMVWEFHDNSRP